MLGEERAARERERERVVGLQRARCVQACLASRGSARQEAGDVVLGRVHGHATEAKDLHRHGGQQRRSEGTLLRELPKFGSVFELIRSDVLGEGFEGIGAGRRDERRGEREFGEAAHTRVEGLARVEGVLPERTREPEQRAAAGHEERRFVARVAARQAGSYRRGTTPLRLGPWISE